MTPSVNTYVVRAIVPLSTVDHPSFKKLVATLLDIRSDSNVSCINGRQLRSNINKKYTAMKADIRKALAEAEKVCTTADIWSAHGRSFLGVTVHWIDP
jgi:hypothetical protein